MMKQPSNVKDFGNINVHDTDPFEKTMAVEGVRKSSLMCIPLEVIKFICIYTGSLIGQNFVEIPLLSLSTVEYCLLDFILQWVPTLYESNCIYLKLR